MPCRVFPPCLFSMISLGTAFSYVQWDPYLQGFGLFAWLFRYLALLLIQYNRILTLMHKDLKNDTYIL